VFATTAQESNSVLPALQDKYKSTEVQKSARSSSKQSNGMKRQMSMRPRLTDHNDSPSSRGSSGDSQSSFLGKSQLPSLDGTKFSSKRCGVVQSYGANTHQGIHKKYNEDRVAIVLNIPKPADRVGETWPRCSYFAIFDGHGGNACAEFLKQQLHKYIVEQDAFPWDPKEALLKGFEAAEEAFMDLAVEKDILVEKSGSCANVVLIIGEMCYCANVGDSRGILSSELGRKVFMLSKDHKPSDELESKRVMEAGGKVYSGNSTPRRKSGNFLTFAGAANKESADKGPLRIYPGRLAVSRAFGDPEAKLQKLGGNPKVLIAKPDIRAFKILKEHDFILIGCDGIYDRLSNREIVQAVWTEFGKLDKEASVHLCAKLGVEAAMRSAMLKKSPDNLSVIVIGLSNLKNRLMKHSGFHSSLDSGRGTGSSSMTNIIGGSQSPQTNEDESFGSAKLSSRHRERNTRSSDSGRLQFRISTPTHRISHPRKI